MIKQATKDAVDAAYQTILLDCFGLWSNCLWRRYDGVEDFSELKEAFFYLVGRLLDEQKVRFLKPNQDVYFIVGKPTPKKNAKDEGTHWLTSNQKVIAYLREKWPETANHFDDIDLNFYFYEIPPMVWRDENGEWHGS